MSAFSKEENEKIVEIFRDVTSYTYEAIIKCKDVLEAENRALPGVVLSMNAYVFVNLIENCLSVEGRENREEVFNTSLNLLTQGIKDMVKGIHDEKYGDNGAH